MAKRLPAASIFRLWAFLLLATIGLQAIIPVGSPLHLSSGSVFSADTFEVAIGPQRQNRRDGSLAPYPLDSWLPQQGRHALPQPTPTVEATPFDIAPGPLAHSLHHWRHAPRAPPAA